MNENQMKIQAVLNTLPRLEMPMTYNNANYLTGIYNTLIQVRDALGAAEDKAEEQAEEPAEEG